MINMLLYSFISFRCILFSGIRGIVFKTVVAIVSMGVDSQNIINIGDTLLGQNPDTFSADFERNREMVERLTDIRSRRIRNRIAGYITRQKINPPN